jgi:hypothetical protein
MGDNNEQDRTGTEDAEPNPGQNSQPARGALNWDGLISHVKEHKLDIALWFTRVITIFFTVSYFIPVFG